MKKEFANKPDIKLVGLTTRTNNRQEMDPSTAKIATIAGSFWSQNIAALIPHRKKPGTTFAVYTEYDSDEHGDYTYFIGEEVHSFDHIPSNLQQLTIPAANYQKFSTPSGKMPAVVIEAWQKIWRMSAEEFGAKRAYQADFEVYDERAQDPNNTCLEIYIGII